MKLKQLMKINEKVSYRIGLRRRELLERFDEIAQHCEFIEGDRCCHPDNQIEDEYEPRYGVCFIKDCPLY